MGTKMGAFYETSAIFFSIRAKYIYLDIKIAQILTTACSLTMRTDYFNLRAMSWFSVELNSIRYIYKHIYIL